MVFVRHRRAEQRHEAVAEELVDGAFEAVHFGQRQREELVEQVVHRVGTQALRELGRIGHVAKQHRDLLAFAFQRRVRLQDLLRQVRRRVVAQHGARGMP